MKMRGVRGATTIDDNTASAILAGTRELLAALVASNGIDEEDVASVLFTATPDLSAAFPAKAAREFGWSRTALMGFQEMDVPGAPLMCVRILIHWNTDKAQDAIQHLFLHGAAVLRPDLNEDSL